MTLKYTIVKYAFRVVRFSFDGLMRPFISFNGVADHRVGKILNAPMPAEDLGDPKEGFP